MFRHNENIYSYSMPPDNRAVAALSSEQYQNRYPNQSLFPQSIRTLPVKFIKINVQVRAYKIRVIPKICII